MDFFSHQEAARRRTWWLVVLFFAALIGIIVTAYVAVTLILQAGYSSTATSQYQYVNPANRPPLFQPEIFLGVSGIISAIVLAASGAKLMELKQGGGRIAESLGGVMLSPGTSQFHERRLLNVVEEMAIASGVPVPPVYLMRGEKGINAFAAGYSIHDAVIGVTEGAMVGLKREELQGVIAHEFSHILNGDMRLNIKLIGILHGLLVLAIIGRVLLRSGRYTSGRKNNGAALILLLGLALVIIGYFGYFFGGLIKRAVSRQREYLADASAVQFTRETSGLAGALKKIGGLVMGSRMQHPHAEEVSHMFFADGIRRFFGGASLFSTHPPLDKRVRILDPSFDGEFPMLTEDALYLSGQDAEKPGKETQDGRKADKKAAHPDFLNHEVLLGGVLAGGSAGAIMQQVGVLDALGQDTAKGLIGRIDKDLADAARDPVGAQACVFALLIGRAEEDSADAWTWVPAAFIDKVSRMLELVGDFDRTRQFMMLELCLPALKTLAKEQAKRFVQVMQQIIDADQQLDLFEFAVSEIVHAGLRQTLGQPVPRVHIGELSEVSDEVSALMSMAAHAGATEPEAVRSAFDAGAAALGEDGQKLAFGDQEVFDYERVKGAMKRMLETRMPVRRKVLEAILGCILADEKATEHEVELFRAIAAAMEVPVPAGVLAKLQGTEAVG